jgi:hypothetical protein
MAKKIDYNARNFAQVRNELFEFVKQYYPDVFSDFNDASVGMMLLELNAAVGDMLSFHTDRMFNETQINYIQERSSVLELARTFGLNIPGKRPSITLVEWSVTVPTDGDTFNLSYCPLLLKGAQATGAGKVFELIEDCDFASPFTTGGVPNRKVIPNINESGLVDNYTLSKLEIVLNGSTKIYKRIINPEDYKPFLEILLPEDNVLSIENIITLEGTNLTTEPTLTQFTEFDNNYYEVEALAQAEIFIQDPNLKSDNSGIIPGRWKNSPQRFIKEFTDNTFCKIIFGGGQPDISELNSFVGCRGQIDKIGDFLNNLSLGVIPVPARTMFVKYRIGGGNDSNIGPNTLNSLGKVEMIVNGDEASKNQGVSDSLVVNNPIPAIGGKDQPSVNEIRNLIRYNFSAQNRCVTIKDYQSRISLMPGRYGVPFRIGVWEERNKVNVTVLALNENSQLTNQSTSTLKENIAEYLADFRMLNDYVTIKDGKIINIGFEISVFTDKSTSKGEIMTDIIDAVTKYFDINNWGMGDNIYLAQLIENINNVGGVLNVTDLIVFNKVGNNKYSLNTIAQPYIDEATREIDLLGEYTLYGEPNAMFEIKYPNNDIKVRTK